MADHNRLIERLAGGVFDPPVAYDDLADCHLEFQVLAQGHPEGEIRERAERDRGCCAVVGCGGAGKSSLIAAVASSLSPTRFPVRIQGVSDPNTLTREGFALHVGRETLRAIEAIEIGRPRRRGLRRASEGLAQTRSRSSGGVSLTAALPVGFSAELKTSAEAVVEDRSPASIAQAVEQLISVTERFDRRMLLVVEDTDVFMPPDPLNSDERERPRRFVDQVVSYLARDFPSSSLVAVHERYSDLLPQGTVTIVKVPSLELAAIGRLIEHYVLRADLHVAAEQIATSDALNYAAGRYAETGDVRRVLELFHRAARKMAGDGGEAPITAEVLHGL